MLRFTNYLMSLATCLLVETDITVDVYIVASEVAGCVKAADRIGRAAAQRRVFVRDRISPLYKTYDPDQFSEDSARWAIDFVDNLLYLKWQGAIKDLRAARDPLEEGFFKQQDSIDAKALELHKKNPKLAQKFLTDYTETCMEKTVKMYRELRNLLITKYTNNKQGL